MTIGPAGQRRRDDVGHVLGAICGVEQRLGLRGDLGRGIEQQLAQASPHRGVARLVRQDDLVAVAR